MLAAPRIVYSLPTLLAFVLVGCMPELYAPRWEGLDNSTAFHLCANAPPPLFDSPSTTISLTVSPSFRTAWLMRIHVTNGNATFNLSTQDDLTSAAYSSEVNKELSDIEWQSFIAEMNRIGILIDRPSKSGTVDDGVTLLFEYYDGMRYLGFGDNNSQQLRDLQAAMLSACGASCDRIWSVPYPIDGGRAWEQCVPILRAEPEKLSEYQRLRIDFDSTTAPSRF